MTQRMFKKLVSLLSYNIAAQIINLISLVVFIRIFPSDAFGKFAMWSGSIWILVVIATMQAEHFILRYRSNLIRRRLTLSISLVVILISIVVLIISLALMWLGLLSISLALILFFSVLCFSLLQVLRYYCSIDGQTQNIGISFFISSIGILISTCLVYLVTVEGEMHFSLLLGQFVGYLCALVFLMYKNSWFIMNFNTRQKQGIRTLYLYRRLIRGFLISNLLKTAILRSPVIIISATGHSSVAGFLAITERVIGIPLQLLGNSLAVLLKERLSNDGQSASANFLVKKLSLLILIALVVCISVFIVVNYFGNIFLTGTWLEGDFFFVTWTVYIACNFIFISLEDLLLYQRRIGYRMKINFFNILIILLLSAMLYVGFISIKWFIVTLILLKVCVTFADIKISYRGIK